MGKQIRSNGPRLPDKPIELVCVSTQADGRPAADPTNGLTRVDGRWAWCPRGGRTAHAWQRVTAGSLNAMRDQLAELSRLVGVVLETPVKPARAPKGVARGKRRPVSTRTKRKR